MTLQLVTFEPVDAFSWISVCTSCHYKPPYLWTFQCDHYEGDANFWGEIDISVAVIRWLQALHFGLG